MATHAEIFRALHIPGQPFVLANAWDAGSAKMLKTLGAKAIATSSAAHAFTLGRPDGGNVTRDEALEHAQDLIAATGLPVQGDFENGFGDAPDICAETIRLAVEIGLAGVCIEDINPLNSEPYAFELSVERIRAASDAARTAESDFVLTARADGIMTGAYNIDEALRRLHAFESAGADCLYAPLPRSMDDLKRICGELTAPVNVLAAGSYTGIRLQEFADAGVARISLGSSLARVTHRVIQEAALEIFDQGSFERLGHGLAGNAVDAMLADE